MTNKELIEVIHAYEDGKTIERSLKDSDDWCITHCPLWNFERYDYRIKPEPHYRPFKSAEEVMEAIKEHGILVREKDRKVIFTILLFEDNYIKLATTARNFSGAFKTLTFADGTPFGKLEEE